MNSLLLRTLAVPRNSSLQAFSEYRELEAQNTRHATGHDGALLEYETLELRVHPPNVIIDNEIYEDRTAITVDSANRPGTLVEVVQCLTELGLNVRKARISSDGGWFVDEFHVTDGNRKVTSEPKLKVIRKMLSVEYESEHEADNTDQFDEARQNSTVFELAGQDRAGLLADVIQLLTHNGCDVRSAAVWTYKFRVAFVVSVLEKGGPIRDSIKLGRLKQLLAQMMDSHGKGIVTVQSVKGLIHYERRLHQLMLREEEKAWEALTDDEKRQWYCRNSAGPGSVPPGPVMDATGGGSGPSSGVQSARSSAAGSLLSLPSGGSTPALRSPSTSFGASSATAAAAVAAGGLGQDLSRQLYISPKASKPQVSIQHYGHLNYWMVTIRCKDRNKLFFDTVCSLADHNYDVYHGAIDSEGESATQLYYIRPRTGEFVWNDLKAAKLRYLLDAAIQRRFPKGLKVHVQSLDHNCFAALTQAFKEAGLWITRAKVRPYSDNGHTFYVMDAAGGPPDSEKVKNACAVSGGRQQAVSPEHVVPGSALVPGAAGGKAAQHKPAAGPSSHHKFVFTFLQRTFDGSPNSFGTSV